MQDLSTPRDLWDDAERLSIDELRAIQLDRLKDTLTRVYAHVPHYTAAFDQAGIQP